MCEYHVVGTDISVGPDGFTRFHLSTGSIVTVHLAAKWCQDLDIAAGDRAVVCTRRDLKDVFLIIKAPFGGWRGHKVYGGSRGGSVRFSRTFTRATIKALFEDRGRRDWAPTHIACVTLSDGVKALALKCPEGEEERKREWVEMSDDIMVVSTESEEVAITSVSLLAETIASSGCIPSQEQHSATEAEEPSSDTSRSTESLE